jgi:hypothetical protein
MFQERVALPPLTAARVAWIQFALTHYGVSDNGAKQFAGGQVVTDASDRQKLLDVLNRVVVDESRLPPGFRGKGGR